MIEVSIQSFQVGFELVSWTTQDWPESPSFWAHRSNRTQFPQGIPLIPLSTFRTDQTPHEIKAFRKAKKDFANILAQSKGTQ
jgi:hypothetical protein